MKRHIKFLPLAILIILTAGIFLSGCSSDTPNELMDEENITESPESSFITEDVEEDPSSDETSEEQADLPRPETEEVGADDWGPSTVLSDAEVDHLVFMREEEKLAHDVYLALFDHWDLPLFDNIAQSEATHTEAVKDLLDKYDIPDPADASPPWVFANSDLQKMYNNLTEQGTTSLSAALKVGAAIEEIDIFDLQSALEETETADIKRVYENLLKGSENHLRAFTSTLSRQTGETYEPQYLSQDAYDAIVAGENARGGGYGRGGGRRP